MLSVQAHGKSFWAETNRIDAQQLSDDNAHRAFFVKTLRHAVGKAMVRGEFESMRAIHAVSPSFVPRPVAWGTLRDVPDAHFFLCEFRTCRRR